MAEKRDFFTARTTQNRVSLLAWNPKDLSYEFIKENLKSLFPAKLIYDHTNGNFKYFDAQGKTSQAGDKEEKR